MSRTAFDGHLIGRWFPGAKTIPKLLFFSSLRQICSFDGYWRVVRLRPTSEEGDG